MLGLKELKSNLQQFLSYMYVDVSVCVFIYFSGYWWLIISSSGLGKIEDLQYNSNEQVYLAALNIINRFFSEVSCN